MNEIGLALLKATDHRFLLSMAFLLLAGWSLFYRWRGGTWPAYAIALQFGGVILSAYSLVGIVALMLTRPLACESLSPESVAVLGIMSFLSIGYSIKLQLAPCVPSRSPLQDAQREEARSGD
jgi:hypothetical protein